VIRGLLGGAFSRWGLPGLACAVLLMLVAALWLVTTFVWLATGIFLVFGGLAGLGYFLLLVFLVRWLHGRRRAEHLLEHGRRRWPE
jgi:hypothetical protein